MSTTHNLSFTRFTRQVRTNPQALLSTNVAAENALSMLMQAPWVEQSTEANVTFPARSAVQDGFNPAWDAFKHVGNYASGYQRAYAGMVAYRFQVPAAAITGPTDITSIAIPIYVDRWLVDGIRVAAYLSDSPSPSADWTTIRAGDINATDVLPMTYTDPAGERIVIEKNGTTTLTWPAETESKAYIYVLLTLEDYATTRGFWIEGASLIRADAAVTTFAASVTADPVVAPALIVPVRRSGLRKRYLFTGAMLNLLDPVLRKDWAAKMLSGGRVDISTADPYLLDQEGDLLSPSVQLSGANASAAGYIMPIYCPVAEIGGKSLFLKIAGSSTGVSPVRVSLFTGAAAPDPLSADTWRGVGAIATGVFDSLVDGQEITIAITGDATGDIWLVGCIEYVYTGDGTGLSGFSAETGVSLTDAYIGETRVELTASPLEIIGFDAAPDYNRVLFLPLLRGAGTMIRTAYSLSGNTGIYKNQTTLPWLSTPPATIFIASAASNEYTTELYNESWAVGYANDYKLYIAGTPPHADIIALNGTVSYRYPVAMSNCLLGFDHITGVFTKVGVDSVFDVTGFPVSDDVGFHNVAGSGRMSVVVVSKTGTCYITGQASSAAISAVEALASINGLSPTGAAVIATSDTHIIALHTDGTVSVIDNDYAYEYQPGHGIDVSAWTDIIGVAACANAVFGWKADGSYVYSGITSWIDFSQLSGRSVNLIIGSAWQRVCFRCSV